MKTCSAIFFQKLRSTCQACNYNVWIHVEPAMDTTCPATCLHEIEVIDFVNTCIFVRCVQSPKHGEHGRLTIVAEIQRNRLLITLTWIFLRTLFAVSH